MFSLGDYIILALIFLPVFVVVLYIVLTRKRELRGTSCNTTDAPLTHFAYESPESKKAVAPDKPAQVFRTNNPEYERFLSERNAKYLVHFTRADNLESIFEHGIVPRALHSQLNIQACYTDLDRIDNRFDASCFSFMHPNYKMFYVARERTHLDYVVLYLDSAACCNFESAFYITNAAHCERNCYFAGNHKNFESLRDMFADFDDGMTRKDYGIKDYFPTDPQAEVLIFDTIPPEYIKGVFFESDSSFRFYSRFIPTCVTCKIADKPFLPRDDYKIWQGKRRKVPLPNRIEDLFDPDWRVSEYHEEDSPPNLAQQEINNRASVCKRRGGSVCKPEHCPCEYFY